MIQGSFIQQSIRDGSCVLYHDYRLGHAQDLSSYGNHGVVVTPAFFQRDGLFIENGGNGGVQVTASVSIDLDLFTSVSFFAHASAPGPNYNLRQLARKQGPVAALSWSIRASTSTPGTTTQIDATTSPVWVATRLHYGVRYYGCSMQTGTVNNPLYYDGVLADDVLNTSLTIVKQASADLYVGNIFSGSRGIGGCYSSYMMFNRLLTSTEHARLYGELMK